MNSSYHHIISIGYCNAQSLLNGVEPIAYSARSEGWACDYYDIDGVLISTGYAPLSAKNTHSTYEIIKRYNDMAQAITSNYDLNYEERAERINALLRAYVQEVTK